MTAETVGTYTTSILNADWSDPDAVRVGEDFYLTTSGFGRAPGRPLLHSRDLVNWTRVRLDEAPAGRGRDRASGAPVRLSGSDEAPLTPSGRRGRERHAMHRREAPEGQARLHIEIGAGARCGLTCDVGDGLRPSGQVFVATP